MINRTLRILQVTTEDCRSGAGLIGWGLFQTYRTRGYRSWLAVGKQHSRDPDVRLVPNPNFDRKWRRFWWRLQSRLQLLGGQAWGVGQLGGLARTLAEPGKALDYHRGIEDFRFPGTWQLLNLTEQRPDIIHCHNLHGGYFDLRALPWLSRQIPVVLTLHDAWLLSGHCAHSIDCERWKMGCGLCPDLTLYPAIRRDATAYNWRRKREIFKKSRLFVATPSRWLMGKVEESMLLPGVADARVIPNGVDLSVFHPANKQDARSALGIPRDALVILFTANAPRQNIWKDYQTVQDAVALAAASLNGQNVLFLALGQDGKGERIGPAEVRFVRYQTDPEVVACYYQAADVYVHAARVDTFPNTVLEALACGTPVVATAVGGIPEQIEDERTGFLVPAGDAQSLADRLTQLLSDSNLRQAMGMRAAEVVALQFDLRQQADAYLAWYDQLVHERPFERLARNR
jgi:glycosyltransferase involved in cell wall biosynthesis